MNKRDSIFDLKGKRVAFIIARRRYEEHELSEPKRLLMDAGAEFAVFSSTGGLATGMNGGQVNSTRPIRELSVTDYDAIIFIGGNGSVEYWHDADAHRIACQAAAANKIIAAICYAPVSLANAGILKGKRATVFKGEEHRIAGRGAVVLKEPVVIDENLITAEGPEVAQEFGEAIVTALYQKRY